jgi:dTDP-glucose 4,6-dehydratase
MANPSPGRSMARELRPSRSVLVTGGLGFIGSHLVRRLLSERCIRSLTVLDSRSFGDAYLSRLIIPDDLRLRIVKGDVREDGTILGLAAGCDAIFHLAARTHVQESIRDPRSHLDVNGFGTLSVLEAARAHGCRVILASSSEVYGNDASGDGICEHSPCRPRSPYAASKAASDHLSLAYGATYGLDVTILRLFNVFGPGQYFEKVVPMFICSALCDKALPMQGDGTAVREWIYVDDVCEALAGALHTASAGVLHNVSAKQTVSIGILATKVIALSRKKHLRVVAFPDRPGQLQRQSAAHSREPDSLQQDRTTFDSALRDTYRWYAANVACWRPHFERDRPVLLESMSNHLAWNSANAPT